MNELYELIEKKIKESGYPRQISGADHITINDEDFNLGVLTMKTPEGTFEVDFDK